MTLCLRQLAFYQILLKYFRTSVIAFSASVPYNRKRNGMQAAGPCESIGRLMPSSKGAKLMGRKVFKGSVGHQELAAWVEGLEL